MSKIKMNYCINKNLYDLKKEVNKYCEEYEVVDFQVFTVNAIDIYYIAILKVRC